jgi:hypothetical protein
MYILSDGWDELNQFHIRHSPLASNGCYIFPGFVWYTQKRDLCIFPSTHFKYLFGLSNLKTTISAMIQGCFLKSLERKINDIRMLENFMYSLDVLGDIDDTLGLNETAQTSLQFAGLIPNLNVYIKYLIKIFLSYKNE